jgi:DMSO reductase anchor subunit
MPADISKGDAHLLRPEHAHPPLIFLTVFTQVGLGMTAGLAMAVKSGHSVALAWASLVTLAVTGMGLNASLFHLGRPIHALRALKGWRRSWLSREVIGLSAFLGAAHVLAGAAAVDAWFGGLPASWILPAASGLALFTGLAGVYASARIYLAPARPAWNSFHTMPHFFLPGLAVGLLMTQAVMGLVSGALNQELGVAAAALGLASLTVALGFQMWIKNNKQNELRLTGLLFRRRFPGLFATFVAAWTAAFSMIFWGDLAPGWVMAQALTALGAMAISRYLFFVTVVPKSMPGHFFGGGGGGH